ncbi:Cof-type HAD-IIB family hydrolase [Synergistaceae bacterium OttesenSCG-928-D05]|nr:Cof-type HAD-IIB family hydrolase [Synergistaceae bacterium OttesenSCG-928-D05]
MKKPKLIAVDMDGTLLNERSELTERTEKALHNAIADGIKVVVATGRMYPSALPFVKRLGTDAPCIFYNGAIVRNPVTKEIYYERGLGEETTADILSLYKDNNWYVQTYFDDKLYVVDDKDERCKYYESISRMKAVPLGEEFWRFGVDSTKMLGIAFDPEEYSAMTKATTDELSGRVYAATSWGSFIEMVHPDVNKAKALESVATMLGIAREDVMAFGDGSNDKEMLLWAGTGVAMGNACDKVLAVADIVAPSNDDDGIAVIVEELLR